MASSARSIWKKRVERWKRSGESATRFAARLDVNPYTLKWWRWRLAQEQPARRAGTPRVAAAQFVELVRSGEEVRGPATEVGGTDSPDGKVELSFPSGLRVLLPAGFDAEAVGRLVAAIERG